MVRIPIVDSHSMLYPKNVFFSKCPNQTCVFSRYNPPGISHEIPWNLRWWFDLGRLPFALSHLRLCPGTCGGLGLCSRAVRAGDVSWWTTQLLHQVLQGTQLGTSEAFRVKWRLGKLFFDHRFKEAPHKKDAISSNTYWDSNVVFFWDHLPVFLSLHKNIYIYNYILYDSWLILDGCSMFVCIPGNPVAQ